MVEENEMIIINIDCETTLIKDLTKYLKYPENISKNFEELFIEYLNVKNKTLCHIENNIDKVYISNELKNGEQYKKFKSIIKQIKSEFENNNFDNIKKRLSKKAEIPYFKDYLLNNWDIYHLHLCDDMPNCRNRKKELLFVKFYENDVYFIDIKDHNSFSSKELVEIIHNNWSQIIKYSKVENIIDIQPRIENDKDIFDLWKDGINVFIPVYDKKLQKEVFYTPLSLGINIQGYRINDVFELTNFKRECDNIKKYLDKYSKEIQQFILKIKKIKFNILKFTIKLNFEKKVFYLLEKNSNLIFGWDGKEISLLGINKREKSK